MNVMMIIYRFYFGEIQLYWYVKEFYWYLEKSILSIKIF